MLIYKLTKDKDTVLFLSLWYPASKITLKKLIKCVYASLLSVFEAIRLEELPINENKCRNAQYHTTKNPVIKNDFSLTKFQRSVSSFLMVSLTSHASIYAVDTCIMYCLSKKSLPILYSTLLNKLGQDFLYNQYMDRPDKYIYIYF